MQYENTFSSEVYFSHLFCFIQKYTNLDHKKINLQERTRRIVYFMQSPKVDCIPYPTYTIIWLGVGNIVRPLVQEPQTISSLNDSQG